MHDESNECPGSDEEYSSIIDTERSNFTPQENNNEGQQITEEQAQPINANEDQVQNGSAPSQNGGSSSGSIVQERSRSHSHTISPESSALGSNLTREAQVETSQPSENKATEQNSSFVQEDVQTNYSNENHNYQEQYEQRVDNSKISDSPSQPTNFQTGQFTQVINSSGFNANQTGVSSSGRLVIDAVPSMNSRTNDVISNMQQNMGSMALGDNSYSQVRNYSSTQYDQPRTVQNNVVRPAAPYYSDTAKTFNMQSPVPSMPSAMYAHPTYASPPRSDRSSPARKSSANSVHIGSHVISTDSGPSLTLSLRRPTSERQWGFTFHGGSEVGCPPFVNKISTNSLAQKFGLEIGDVIVSICNALTVGKTNEQLRAEILRAGNELDLVLIRRGVDINKIAQIAPFAIPSSPQSAPVTYGSKSPNIFNFNENRRTIAAKPTRQFRNVQTKSLQILEKQLSAGETPGSVLKTKQHYQNARGLPASGSSSSFATVYGQGPLPGYSGRDVKETCPQTNTTTVQCNIKPLSPKPVSTSYASVPVSGHQNYQKVTTTAAPWSQNKPLWEDQNVNWVTAIPSTPYTQDNTTTQQTFQNVTYPAQSRFPDEMTVLKHNISPVGSQNYSTQTWIGRTT